MSAYKHHFGLNNIPFGIASNAAHLQPQCATRFEDTVIFLADLARDESFPGGNKDALLQIFSEPTLNSLASMPRDAQRDVRQTLQALLKSKHSFAEHSTCDIAEAQMHLPMLIHEFADFSVAEAHLLNMGEMFTGTRGVPPAARKFPIGYGGRASSIVVSGTPIERPIGQYMDRSNPDAPKVVCGPTQSLDYELELAAIVGKSLPRGQRVLAEHASEHIFGYVLLNDWTARDIQGFESNPVGPLCGKSLGTTISPWVVTPDALGSMTTMAADWDADPAPHLRMTKRTVPDLTVEAQLRIAGSSTMLSKSSTRTMTWTFEQILAHMTLGGCGLRTGDVLACGTLSGMQDAEKCCLCELSWGGKQPVKLTDGSTRRFLEDGDEITLTGMGGSPESGVGFGDCTGVILPAKPL